MNPCTKWIDSSVHLIYHDPSDLGSLILIRIISKECTLYASLEVTYLDVTTGTGKTVCYNMKRGFIISKFFSTFFTIHGVKKKIVHYTKDFVIHV